MPKHRAKAPRSVPDPRHVYTHAMRFHRTEGYLRRASVGDERMQLWAMMPAITLSAFAAELFLKCLLIIDDKPPPDEHHLGKLFALLSTIKRKRIEELWNRAVAANESEFAAADRRFGAPLARDLEGALEDCGNTFKGMRYIYEDPEKVKFYIIDFPEVLKTVILECRAEWA